MGKKRIITTQDDAVKSDGRMVSSGVKRTGKKQVMNGIAYINVSYNNTLVSITDFQGGIIAWSSAGKMGFKGTKKGTPYAATKVAEFLGEKAKVAGIKTLIIKVKGVGAGRDAAMRSFAAQGFEINSIRDVTPIPHNGPKPAKPRRV